jgi:serine palmitoyltransferase
VTRTARTSSSSARRCNLRRLKAIHHVANADANTQEINELVQEWQPEPLLWEDPERSALPSPPVIVGPPSLHPRVVQSLPESGPYLTRTASGLSPDSSSNKAAQGKEVINLASVNFSGLALNDKVKEKAIQCLRSYGVGSCGPSGFYGFFDVHIEFENALAAFLGVEAAIIYAQGFTTVCSVIPSFAKRGDIIVADKGVNFAIQKGIQISRSHVRWYEHNDMDSLEAVLESIARENKRNKAPLTRRFIVTEGLFEGDGQISDLPRLVRCYLMLSLWEYC